MKDNKLYKVLRIIFLTLAIISLVFTLCKKVGLCASSETRPISSYPLPYGAGSGYGYNDNVISDTMIENVYNTVFSGPYQSWFSDDIVIYIREIGSNYVQFGVLNCTSFSGSNYSTFSSSTVFTYNYNAVNNVTYSFSSGSSSVSFANRVSGSVNCSMSGHVSASPTGGNILDFNEFIFGYPVFFSNPDYPVLDNVLIFGFPSSSFLEGSVTSLPNFDSLPGSVVPTDDQPTLFDKLKGWLSTISGNIQKGFKNIEENLTSFFKPYLDNIKAFYEWVTEPFDPEAASDSLEAIQAISDIRALNNVIGTAGIFNWSDVTPASRVAFTFDFGGAVLPHHQYEINFDWYTGTVKTLILSILVTFLVVGLLVTIINNIPSMIHGHSGDSGGGSN